MKILFIAQNYFPNIGGIEVVIGELASRLVEMGHPVTVVTTDRNEGFPAKEVRDGVVVHRLNLYDAMLRQDIERMLEETRRLAAVKLAFQPDIAHVHVSDPGLFAHLRTDSAHACPTIMTAHMRLPRAVLDHNSVLYRGFDKAAVIVAVSEVVRSDIKASAPSMAGKVATINNGLPAPGLVPAALDFEAPKILCIGRIVESKAFDIAVAAFPGVLGAHPLARLIIAGDGPVRETLERQADELGVRQAVDFAGWVAPEDVPALINTVTVVVVPSRSGESFGMVALHAAQMGRPVVAARRSVPAEVVENGETGILVPKDRPVAFAEAIGGLLTDRERTRCLGRQARVRAVERFDFDSFVSTHYDLYRQVLEQPR